MQWLSSFLLAVQVLASISVIVLVLLQQGKGADMGSSFGGGSAGSLFGAAGAANFLSRATRWAAIVFFAATIGLAYNAHNTGNSILDGGLMQDYQSGSSEPVPANGSAVPQAPAATGSEVPAATGSDVPAAPAPEAAPAAAVPEAPAAAPAAEAPASAEVPAASSAQPADTAETTQPEASSGADSTSNNTQSGN